MQARSFLRTCRPLLIPLGIAAAFQVRPAFAQTAADAAQDSQQQLGNVTVTAQKRKEKAQDVPVATSVISASDVEHAGLNNIQDAAALTPNLVIIDQLRPGIQTVSFRGFTTVQGGQSPFAIVVDGVAQPGQEFLKQQFVDVEQIEVLRGPQGTLYGAGAIAGAINIVTKPPTDFFEAAAKIGVAQGGQATESVSLSGPLKEGVAWYRFGVNQTDFDGLITNTANGDKVDFAHETTLHSEVLLKPSDRLNINLRANATNGRNGSLWLIPVSNADFDNWSKEPSTDITGRDKRLLQTYSAKVDYAFDTATLTSITAFNRALQFATADGDFSASPLYGQTWTNNSRALSEELRLTSSETGPWRWNLGAFAQRYDFHDVSQFGTVQSDGSVYYAPGSDSRTNTRSDSWALFGQATYDLTPLWSLTGGLRYDSVDATGDDPGTGWNASHTFSELQPKLSAAYKLTPDSMTYATYSTGFRTGGFNPNTPLIARLYENEVSKTFEAGYKSTFLNNRLLFNAALFHTKFENQQYFYSLATSSGIYRAITNIPETSVDGAELELQYRLNKAWKLQGSMGYNDTKIKKFDQGQYNGNRVPQVYGFTSNVGAEYQHTLWDDKQLVARLDWAHRGEVYWDTANTVKTPAKDFFNTRVAIEWAGAGQTRWQLAFVGKNLTDERTPAAVGANALGTGYSLRSGNEPRQLGVELEVKY